jgi:hypothetical protein
MNVYVLERRKESQQSNRSLFVPISASPALRAVNNLPQNCYCSEVFLIKDRALRALQICQMESKTTSRWTKSGSWARSRIPAFGFGIGQQMMVWVHAW